MHYVFFVRSQHLDLVGSLLCSWLLLDRLSQLGLCHKRGAVLKLLLVHHLLLLHLHHVVLFKLLIDVGHCDRNRLVKFFDGLISLLEFSLNAADCKLEQLVLTLGFDDLVLQKVLVLLESL